MSGRPHHAARSWRARSGPRRPRRAGGARAPWLATAALLALFGAIGLGASRVSAQDDAGPPPRVRTHVERAPDRSLRRGYVDVPRWAPYGLGALVALGAAGLLVWRMRRDR